MQGTALPDCDATYIPLMQLRSVLERPVLAHVVIKHNKIGFEGAATLVKAIITCQVSALCVSEDW